MATQLFGGEPIRRSFEEALPDLTAAINRRANVWEYVPIAMVTMTEPERCVLEGEIGPWSGFDTAEELRQRWALSQSVLDRPIMQWQRVGQRAGAQVRSIVRRAQARWDGDPLPRSRQTYPPKLFTGGIDTSLAWVGSKPNHPMAAEMNERAKLWGEAEGSVGLQREIWERCKADPVYFIDKWLWATDPRHQPTVVPVVMLPQQRALIEWLNSQETKGFPSLLIEGDRDSGKSMLCEAFAFWRFLFHQGNVGVGTRRPHDVMDRFLAMRSRLPAWLLPDTFKHLQNSIVNARSGAQIFIGSPKAIGSGHVLHYCFLDQVVFGSVVEWHQVRRDQLSTIGCLVMVDATLSDEKRRMEGGDFAEGCDEIFQMTSYRHQKSLLNRSFIWDEVMSVSPLGRRTRIAPGPKGDAGVPHIYECWMVDNNMEPSRFKLNLEFQKGPLCYGVNGFSDEMLLAILADRLMAFQSGEFACAENEAALKAVIFALEQFNARQIRVGRDRAETAKP